MTSFPSSAVSNLLSVSDVQVPTSVLSESEDGPHPNPGGYTVAVVAAPLR